MPTLFLFLENIVGEESFIIVKVVSIFTPIRVGASDEKIGLDTLLHGEHARHRDAK